MAAGLVKLAASELKADETGEEGGRALPARYQANDKQHHSLVYFPPITLFLLTIILSCCECCLV